MPGVLLIEAMAQTSGWLVIAVTDFKRMPFLAAVKEAKLRTFVTPGQSSVADGQAPARRLRLRGHQGRRSAATASTSATPRSPSGWSRFPNPEFRASMREDGRKHRVSDGERWPMADAPREAWITGIGIVSCLGEGPEAHWQGSDGREAATSTPTTFAPYRRPSARGGRFRQADPQEGRSAPDGAVAAHRHLRRRSRARRCRRQGQHRTPRPHGHDRRRRRRRARSSRSTAPSSPACRRPRIPTPSSTSG